MEINDYLVSALVAAGFAAGFSFFIFWRFWRRYLAPPAAMCDRTHVKMVNYFWLIVTFVNWFIIYRLLRLVFMPHWLKLKEALGIEGVPYV